MSGEFRKAESDSERRSAVKNLGQFGLRFLNLAQDHPKDAVALSATRQAIQATSSADSLALTAWEMSPTDHPYRTDDKTAQKIVAFLMSSHSQNDKLGPLIDRMRYGYRLEYADFLSAVLQKNPNREIQALACLSLAQNLNDRLEMLRLVKDHPELGSCMTPCLARVNLVALRQRGLEGLSKEIDALFERAGEFTDVEAPTGGSVAEQAKRALHEQRHLAFGKTVQEIEGVDEDGRQFKLSDYRGQGRIALFLVEILTYLKGWLASRAVARGKTEREAVRVDWCQYRRAQARTSLRR